MSPNSLTAPLHREAPALPDDQDLGSAVREVLRSGFPALPVIDADGVVCGLFGEREFLIALFPGYLQEMRSLRFVPRSLDEWLEQRARFDAHTGPMSVYEVHLGSWRQGQTYRDMAEHLVNYVVDLGFTHVELLPLMDVVGKVKIRVLSVDYQIP